MRHVAIIALVLVSIITLTTTEYARNRGTVQANNESIPSNATNNIEILVEHYSDDWAYMVSREPDGFLNVGTRYDGIRGLEVYYRETHEMAADLFAEHSTADVYIYFRRPLLENELPRTILDAPEQVLRYTLLYIDAQGADLWFATERSANNPILFDRAQLQNDYPDLQVDSDGGRHESNNRLVGFTQMEMRVNQAQYELLRQSPDVVALDIGPAIALHKAGFGTHSSDRISFSYPLYAPSDEEINVLEKLRAE